MRRGGCLQSDLEDVFDKRDEDVAYCPSVAYNLFYDLTACPPGFHAVESNRLKEVGGANAAWRGRRLAPLNVREGNTENASRAPGTKLLLTLFHKGRNAACMFTSILKKSYRLRRGGC